MRTAARMLVFVFALAFSPRSQAQLMELYATCPGSSMASCNLGDPCLIDRALQFATQFNVPVRVNVAAGLCQLQGGQMLDAVDFVRVEGAGAGATILDAAGLASVSAFTVNGGTLELRSLTIRNAAAFPVSTVFGTIRVSDVVFDHNQGSFGGAIAATAAVIDIQRTRFVDNSSPIGAIGAESGGRVTIADSTFIGNSASTEGGAVYSAGTPVQITRSTFSGNTAATFGGALRIAGASGDVRDSTFSGNSAASGGAIAMLNIAGGTSLFLADVTIADNTASTQGTALFFDSTQIGATVRNSLISGSCVGVPSNASSVGSVESPGNTCALSAGANSVSVPAASLMLGALANNGGPTSTRLPLAGSVLIDSLIASHCGLVEQRGLLRNVGRCDIGAVEVGATIAALFADGFE